MSCWRWWASTGSTPTASPTSFPAASASASALPGPLAIEPEFIVCDEPISALDVSIQSQVINLLSDLQERLGLTYLFIAHDLNIVKYISDRIAVMYLGNLVELASSDELYKNTLHPYSKALLSAVPIPDPNEEAQKKRIIISGDVPSPNQHPPRAATLPAAAPRPATSARSPSPRSRRLSPGHFVACHLGAAGEKVKFSKTRSPSPKGAAFFASPKGGPLGKLSSRPWERGAGRGCPGVGKFEVPPFQRGNGRVQ